MHPCCDYGLVVRLRLLPTPPLDDAVTFDYGEPVRSPEGTFTSLLLRALRRTGSGFQPLALGTKRQGCRFYYPARPSPQTKFQVSPAPGGVPCRIIRRGNNTPEHRANFRLRSRSGFQPLSLGTKRQGCRFYYPARPSPQTKFQVRIDMILRIKALESVIDKAVVETKS